MEGTLCSPGAVDEVKVEEAQDGWAGNLGNFSSIVIAAANQDRALHFAICTHST